VRCGKCPLSTAKEIISPVGALLKVSNLKRFLNQFSSGALSKIHAFTAKEGLLQSGALWKVHTFRS
jgi:hypothetical protein